MTQVRCLEWLARNSPANEASTEWREGEKQEQDGQEGKAIVDKALPSLFERKQLIESPSIPGFLHPPSSSFCLVPHPFSLLVAVVYRLSPSTTYSPTILCPFYQIRHRSRAKASDILLFSALSCW